MGEAPGEQEERSGRPFVGPSGAELNKALAMAHIDRRDCLTTNTLLCRPPKNRLRELLTKINRVNKEMERDWKAACKEADQEGAPRPPKPDYVNNPLDCCRPRLEQELASFTNFITLGGTGLKAVTGAQGSVMALRGGLMQLDATMRTPARKVMPTIHPAFCLRQPRWFHVFRNDVFKAGRWFRGESEWAPPTIIWQPTLQQLQAFLVKHKGDVMAFDLETDSIEPLTARIRCLAIGVPDEVIVLSFLSKEGDKTRRFYPHREEVEIINCLRAYFEDPTETKFSWNGITYDATVLRTRWKCEVNNHIDGILIHRSVESELPHSLGYVGSMYTDAPSWKTSREGNKLSTDSESDEELATYCLFEGTHVVLADGSTSPIETLVRQKYTGEVLSLNTETGQLEPGQVVGWHYTLSEKEVDWRVVTVAGQRQRDRGLVVTADHQILTSRGWLEAQNIRPGDYICDRERLITEEEKQAVLGTLLGDSRLVASPDLRADGILAAQSLSLVGSHASSSGFSQWKEKVLWFVTCGNEKPAREVTINGRSGIGGPATPIRSPQMRQLAELAPLVYDEKGSRRIKREALDLLGPRGLAWWYVDDGFKQKRRNGGQETMVFSTQGFPREDIDTAVSWFREHYGPSSAGKDGVIRLAARASRKLAREIASYLPPEARYKLPTIQGEDLASKPFLPLSSSSSPSFREVLSVERYEYRPGGSSESQRVMSFRKRRRYCLDVEGNHNFFTTHGLVHNCALDVAVTARVLPSLVEQLGLRDQREVFRSDTKVQEVCRGMHQVGMYVDQTKRLKAEKELLGRRHELLHQIRDALGRPGFNPGSVYQVRDILFDTWKLEAPLDDKERLTSSDDPSTADIVLRALLTDKSVNKSQREVIKLLRYYRKVMKVLGTYVVKLRPWDMTIEDDLGWDDDDDWVDKETRDRYGLKKRGIVDPRTSRMHPGWSASVAVTGRLSSSKPINAMNFPKKLRGMVTCQPGNVLVGADADQLEIRVAAAHWQVEKYLLAFREGKDPHSMTAFLIFGEAFCKAAGITPDQFERPGKLVGPAYDANGTFCGTGEAASLRKLSKNVHFASQYMAGVERVHKMIQSAESPNDDGTTDLPYALLPLRRVRQMHEKWLEGAPEYEKGWNREIDEWKRVGYLREPVGGRRRDFLDSHGGDEAVNELVNFSIQSGAAAWMNRALIDIYEQIPENKWGPGTGIINQCHDHIVVECPESEAAWVAGVIEEAMNGTHPGLPGVELTATADTGPSWDKV